MNWQNGCVAILKEDNEPIGTGFVVSDKGIIVTCTHLLRLGPDQTIAIQFNATGKIGRAKVIEEWSRARDAEDIAFLCLLEPLPPEVHTLPLVMSSSVTNLKVHSWGYPRVQGFIGLGADAQIVAKVKQNGHNRLQFSSKQITRGYSGGPLWDSKRQAVIGLVNSGIPHNQLNQPGETGFATPSETLFQLCAELTPINHFSFARIFSNPLPRALKSLKESLSLKSLAWSSITSVISGICIATLWMIKEPGYEPLLALLAGLASANLLERTELSKTSDMVLSIIIVIVSIMGILSLAPLQKNHAPLIHDLITSRETVTPGETISITVEATDRDGDPLSYIWSARRGVVPEGNPGPRINYTAPVRTEVGLDTVEVTVTDGKGGISTREVTIAIENQD